MIQNQYQGRDEKRGREEQGFPAIERLVLATHNQGKVKEFQDMLSGVVGEVKSAADFDLPAPEETGVTFEENALIKARAAAQATGLPCLADDSGLAVNALDGAPGVYSARWAGPDKNFQDAMRQVQDKLGDTEDRSAAFVATLALVMPDGREELFEGRVEGDICWPPRGAQGFGYDPIFVPAGDTRSFAEMSRAEKQGLSHRGRALRQLLAFFQEPDEK